jgi:hypothetical protein
MEASGALEASLGQRGASSLTEFVYNGIGSPIVQLPQSLLALLGSSKLKHNRRSRRVWRMKSFQDNWVC